MNDTPLVSPLLDGFTLVDGTPGPGSGVFRVRHEASGTVMFVKHISMPENAADTEALILTGAVADPESAAAYYDHVAEGYRNELKQLRRLSKTSNFVGCTKFQVVPKEDGPGFDFYILSPNRTSLRAFLADNTLTASQAAQLGSDLASALCTLRSSGLAYLDLRPENVFLDDGWFCIGDLGLTSSENMSFAALPAHFVSPYTAPELCGMAGSMNPTVDIYALGMLLYFVYNGNHLPFEEAESTEKAANTRRLRGERLPAPLYADYEMDAIIRKACAFAPKDRYQTPEELLTALEDHRRSFEPGDEPLVPPINSDVPSLDSEDDPFEEEENTPKSSRSAKAELLSDDFKETFAPTHEQEAEPKKKGSLALPILLAVVALLGAALCYFYFFYSAILVSSIEIIRKTPDQITVAVTAEQSEYLTVSCTDDSGNVTGTYRCGQDITFSGLKSGTFYTISVNAIDWHFVKGVLSQTVNTAGITDVLSFYAEAQADGTTLVSFQVSGPEPLQWMLTYESELAEARSCPAVDHQCILTDLLPNSEYTLTLDAGDEYYLGGYYQTTYRFELPITGSNLRLDGEPGASVRAVWDSDSDYPTEWVATCSGSDGYTETVHTTTNYAVFENTDYNVEYTIAVSNSTMTMPLLYTFRNYPCTISEISGSAKGNAVTVSWKPDGSFVPDTWVVSYGLEGQDERLEQSVNGTQLTLNGLAPDATYVFELLSEDGESIGGENRIVLETPVPPTYEAASGYDFGSIDICLYEKPGNDWSVASLSYAKTSFTPTTDVICVIKPTNRPAAEETPRNAMMTLVIRKDSRESEPSCWATETHAWNDLWESETYAMEIRTPAEPGTYFMMLYLDGKLLRSCEFKIA